MSLVIDDQHTIGHFLQHAGQFFAFGFQRVQLGLDLSAHALEDAGQLAHLVAGVRDERIAPLWAVEAHLEGFFYAGGQGADGASGICGDEGRQQDRQARRDQGGDQDDALQVGDIGFDLLQGQGHTHHAERLFARANPHGDVQHLLTDGMAEAGAATRAVCQRLYDLRPVEVVIHLRPVFIGFPKHGATGGDDRNPHFHQVGIAPGKRIQLLGILGCQGGGSALADQPGGIGQALLQIGGVGLADHPRKVDAQPEHDCQK